MSNRMSRKRMDQSLYTDGGCSVLEQDSDKVADLSLLFELEPSGGVNVIHDQDFLRLRGSDSSR